MISKVKNFLENYGHLVNDLEEFFDKVYDFDLEDDDIGYMCSLLDQAGIENINEYRDRSLNKIITMCIAEFSTSKDPDLEVIYLKDFIETFLENNIGYSFDYVQQYIIDHAHQWDHLVDISMNGFNIPFIARKQ